jgi:hypothetical protein
MMALMLDQDTLLAVPTSTLADAPAISVPWGTIVEHASGIALAGVTIVWRGPSATDPTRMIDLGRAISGPDGQFVVTLSDTDDAKATVRRLPCMDPGALTLAPLDVTGDLLPATVIQPQITEGYQIEVTTDSGVGIDRWQALRDYLFLNLRASVLDVAGELSAPSADSPSQAWSIVERAQALNNLHTAAAAAHANDGQALALLTLDEPVKLDALGHGALNEAFFATDSGSGQSCDHYRGLAHQWRRAVEPRPA